MQTVDQAVGGSAWYYLGSYAFGSVGTPAVELSDSGAPGLIADAVRFEFVSTATPPLTIITQSLPQGRQGTYYWAQIQTSGGASPIDFQLFGSLPDGLTLDPQSGVISGVPGVAGLDELTVLAEDGLGTSVSRTVQLEILIADSGLDTVWVDDGNPPGSTIATTGSGWSWRGSSPTTPYSGSLALQSGIGSGEHKYVFYNVALVDGLPVAAGDTLFAYVWLDSANPPRELMLGWQRSNASVQWEHRAYWGENLFNYGVYGTAGRLPMGALPAAGQWVRLDVPAAALGIEGQTVRGFGVLLYDGRAAFDLMGKGMSQQAHIPRNTSRRAAAARENVIQW